MKAYTGKNWSYGIIAAILIFMVFTMVLVYIMVNQKVEVLYSDYYERSLSYDQVQERLSRGLNPAFTVTYVLNASKDSVVFNLPFKESAKGTVAFVKPDDSASDKDFQFDLKQGDFLAVDISAFPKGLWQIELIWTSDSVEVMNRMKLVKS
jgi:hypothetical protein